MGNVLEAIKNSSRLTQKTAPAITAPVDNRGGWYPYVREPYAGAWQNNDGWVVDCVLGHPIVYACTTLIANDIGKLPLRQIEEGQGQIWVPVRDARSEKILTKPNNYQNSIQFMVWWLTSLLVRGNTYILKLRNATGDIIG